MSSIDTLKANMQQVERDLARILDKIEKEEGDLEKLKVEQVKLERKKAELDAQVVKLQAELGKLGSQK